MVRGKWEGQLQKLKIDLGADGKAHYQLDLRGQESTPLNHLVGAYWQLQFQHHIYCTGCGDEVKKTYQDGYCWQCYHTLAVCDHCILQPERCHFAQGTCRQGLWGIQHCFVPHIVYLAWTSGPKVGITRKANTPTRWLDQGAVAALPLIQVTSRFHSGKFEQLFAQVIADKTNWKGMLAPAKEVEDLALLRATLLQRYRSEIEQLRDQLAPAPIEFLSSAQTIRLEYPVESFPEKIRTLSLGEEPLISGKLLGIKGQYLLFAQGVLNMRKHTGYQVSLQIED